MIFYWCIERSVVMAMLGNNVNGFVSTDNILYQLTLVETVDVNDDLMLIKSIRTCGITIHRESYQLFMQLKDLKIEHI